MVFQSAAIKVEDGDEPADRKPKLEDPVKPDEQEDSHNDYNEQLEALAIRARAALNKVEDVDEEADRKPKLEDSPVKPDEQDTSQGDNIAMLEARRAVALLGKVEDEDEQADRKPELRGSAKSDEQENIQGDNIALLEAHRVQHGTKVDESKTDVLADHPSIDQHFQEAEPGDVGVQPAQAGVLVRDGRTLARIEVVLPRWSDVLRRKGRQAQSQPRHNEEQLLPAHSGVMSREVTEVAEHSDVKMEPVDNPIFLADVEPHRQNPGPAEVAQAIQEMRNPDVKVKKELLLNDEYILDALTWEGINNRYPIPVPPEIAEFHLPRAYIHNLYGGGHQVTFPEPNKHFVEWHGLRRWAFLTLEWNPHAPTRPGYSGLFLQGSGPAEDNFEDLMRTFVRVRPGKWVYMGQYRFRPGKSLTAQSWRQQSQVVRRTWAKSYLRMPGANLCVRVWLRKQRGSDYKVTEEDYEAAGPKMQEILKSITEEDINGAFDRGEEEMGVYTMTCVGYDEEFIRFLVRNVRRWDPPAPKKKDAAAQGPAQHKSRKGTGSKRKPIEIDSDDDSEQLGGGAGEPWAAEGDDEDVKPVNSSAQEPERRSTRERVKRVRIS